MFTSTVIGNLRFLKGRTYLSTTGLISFRSHLVRFTIPILTLTNPVVCTPLSHYEARNSLSPTDTVQDWQLSPLICASSFPLISVSL